MPIPALLVIHLTRVASHHVKPQQPPCFFRRGGRYNDAGPYPGQDAHAAMKSRESIQFMKSKRFRTFIQTESVLAVSAFVAALSMAAFPPTPSHLPEYARAIDMRTIGLLFCLMTVISGLTRAGVLGAIRARLAKTRSTARQLSVLLTLISFFSSMVVTNDVALISFVPLTLLLFRAADQRGLIITLVAQTVAANLGSMLTPIGNPQNIYLYSAFNMDPVTFISAIGPYGIAGLAASLAPCLLVPPSPLKFDELSSTSLNPRLLVGYGGLFALSLACVAHLVSWEACTIITIGACLILDRGVLRSVDYSLLATFVCFFIFVGNIGHIDPLAQALRSSLEGREILVAALTSQVISNVPAAIMLSGFTENAAALLIGVNIGGLGTPVASLASLITLRSYARSRSADTGRYLRWFLAINFAILSAFLLIPSCLS